MSLIINRGIKSYDYTRIRLPDVVNTFKSLLTKLREHRLKENIQGSMKLKGELRDHTLSFFEHDIRKNFFQRKFEKKKLTKVKDNAL